MTSPKPPTPLAVGEHVFTPADGPVILRKVVYFPVRPGRDSPLAPGYEVEFPDGSFGSYAADELSRTEPEDA
jgi:hypothetical protein